MFKDIDTALSWVMKRRNETKDFNTFKALMESLDNFNAFGSHTL